MHLLHLQVPLDIFMTGRWTKRNGNLSAVEGQSLSFSTIDKMKR